MQEAAGTLRTPHSARHAPLCAPAQPQRSPAYGPPAHTRQIMGQLHTCTCSQLKNEKYTFYILNKKRQNKRHETNTKHHKTKPKQNTRQNENKTKDNKNMKQKKPSKLYLIRLQNTTNLS